MKSVSSRRTFWLLLIVLTCGLFGASWAISLMPDMRGADLRGNDADTHYFYYAWEETPHFADTLKWWYGPWGQKFRPFYRPISSLLFWTEYKTFGINGRWQFMIVLMLFHFLTLLYIWRFLVDLFGERDGTLSACVWGACLGHYFIWMAPSVALFAWKDNVESWHALAFTACIWAFLRYLKTNIRRWQVAAIFLFWVALCVKEMAYMAPFVMLLLCWHEKKLGEKWRSVIPFFAFAGLMFFFRLWALQGMGFRMEGNAAWKFRLLNDNLGGGFTRILNGDCLMLTLIVFLVGLWWLFQWKRINLEQRLPHFLKGVGFLFTSVLLLFYTANKTDISWDDTLTRYLVAGEWGIMSLLAPLLFFWYRFFQNKNRHQIFGVLFALIIYAPLTSGPNTPHIYYFPSVGWAIWLAYAILDAGTLARNFGSNCAIILRKPKGEITT